MWSAEKRWKKKRAGKRKTGDTCPGITNRTYTFPVGYNFARGFECIYLNLDTRIYSARSLVRLLGPSFRSSSLSTFYRGRRAPSSDPYQPGHVPIYVCTTILWTSNVTNYPGYYCSRKHVFFYACLDFNFGFDFDFNEYDLRRFVSRKDQEKESKFFSQTRLKDLRNREENLSSGRAESRRTMTSNIVHECQGFYSKLYPIVR